MDLSQPDPIQFESWLASSGPPIDRDQYVVDGRICMDYFVRYEGLLEDLKHVCARLGLPWKPDRLPRFKVGPRPDSARIEELYTRTSEEIVRKAYAFELDHFGYSFPG